MTTGIYKITNLINNHIYIGQSIHIERRFREHKCGNELIVDKAIQKYGVENFSFDIVEECSEHMLDERECYWISFYDSYRVGYNCTYGGQGRTCSQVKLSNDDVLKIYQLLLDFEFTQNEIAKRFNVSYQTISDINNGKSRRIDGYDFPLRKHNIQHENFLKQKNNKPKVQKISFIKKERYCIKCGKIISDSSSGLCVDCYNLSQRRVERPSKHKLAEEICETNFLQVGKKYGVSDNAIRKWCKAYDLPTKKKELKDWLDKN